MFPKPKRKLLRPRVHLLDRIFSEYIRLRDADKNGFCQCITCLRFFSWKEMDAGHFIQRDRFSLRWDERNVHAQCPHCNRFRSGMQYEHGLGIDNLHGAGTAQLLSQIGRSRVKISPFDIEFLIKNYREKLLRMRQTKSGIPC